MIELHDRALSAAQALHRASTKAQADGAFERIGNALLDLRGLLMAERDRFAPDPQPQTPTPEAPPIPPAT